MTWEEPIGAAAHANERLALISPRSDRQSWLHCYWEPGEPWMPVHRLIIAEMIPRGIMGLELDFYRMMGDDGNETLFMELEGPDPALSRYFDKDRGEVLFTGLQPTITHRQWVLWREQNAFARPIWVIQGSNGGHKRRFSDLEKVILRKQGIPRKKADAPLPGVLPYATFDDRILDKLEKMRELQEYAEMCRKWASLRSDEEQYKAKMSMEAQVEREIYAWLDPQIEDLAA